MKQFKKTYSFTEANRIVQKYFDQEPSQPDVLLFLIRHTINLISNNKGGVVYKMECNCDTSNKKIKIVIEYTGEINELNN